MKSLNRQLNAYFKPAPAKKPDTQRKAREECKRLAALHDIEIEPQRGGGFNVYKSMDAMEDPFDGDHYANDWIEALPMVRTYAEVKS